MTTPWGRARVAQGGSLRGVGGRTGHEGRATELAHDVEVAKSCYLNNRTMAFLQFRFGCVNVATL